MQHPDAPIRDEFITYLASEEYEPIHVIRAYAKRGSDSPKLWFNLSPAGYVIVYDQFVVFLTPVTDKPGSEYFWKTYLNDLSDNIKSIYNVAKWAHHPASLLVDIAKSLKYLPNIFREENVISVMLQNENSIFVPSADIKNVDFIKGTPFVKATYLRVDHKKGSFVIYGPVDEPGSSPLDLIKVINPNKWEPQFRGYLTELCKKNNKV